MFFREDETSLNSSLASILESVVFTIINSIYDYVNTLTVSQVAVVYPVRKVTAIAAHYV